METAVITHISNQKLRRIFGQALLGYKSNNLTPSALGGQSDIPHERTKRFDSTFFVLSERGCGIPATEVCSPKSTIVGSIHLHTMTY